MVGCRVAWIEQHERSAGGCCDPTQLLLVLGVALLVDQQRGGAVRQRSRGEQAAGRGRLAGPGATALEHVLPLAQGQSRAGPLVGRHRYVLDLLGPWPDVHDLALGRDVPALALSFGWGGLPRPSP